MTEDIGQFDLSELLRGFYAAVEDWRNGAPYASYRPDSHACFKDGYAEFLRGARPRKTTPTWH